MPTVAGRHPGQGRVRLESRQLRAADRRRGVRALRRLVDRSPPKLVQGPDPAGRRGRARSHRGAVPGAIELEHRERGRGRPATGRPRPADRACMMVACTRARLLGRLEERAAGGRPIGVAVVGGGVFASLYLAQALRTPGIRIVGVADLAPARVRERLVGARLARGARWRATVLTDDVAGADRRAGRRGRDRGHGRCAAGRRARADGDRAGPPRGDGQRRGRRARRAAAGAAGRRPPASSTRSPTAISPR